MWYAVAMPEKQHRKSVPKRTKNADSPVAALRHELHMTQQQFAEAMGVTKLTVSFWERGQSTPSRTAERLLLLYRRYPQAARE